MWLDEYVKTYILSNNANCGQIHEWQKLPTMDVWKTSSISILNCTLTKYFSSLRFALREACHECLLWISTFEGILIEEMESWKTEPAGILLL